MRVLLLVAALLLAGCADPSSSEPVADEDDFGVEVTEDTGAIRGVVVDHVIVPIAQATVRLTTVDPPLETTTNAEGRFSFSKVTPGSHILQVSKFGYVATQSATQVEAGVAQPRVVSVQLTPTFTQTPYVADFTFSGRVVCSYSISLAVTGITAPCITDYTALVCPGGCANDLREVQGDTRDWLWAIDAGWKTHIIEMTWKPSAQGTSDQMGFTVSYAGRTASEWFASFGGASPVLGRIDCCEPHSTRQESGAIPEEGIPDLYTFVNVRGSGVVDVAIEQDFQAITHTFYHLEAPEDWSFMAGDEKPY